MEIFKQLEDLVSAKITIFKTVFKIIGLETRLAGKSIFPLLLSTCMLLVFFMTSWLSITVLIGYGVFVLSQNYLLSIVIVLLLNLILCGALAKYVFYNINCMSFEKTRAYFSQQKSIENVTDQKTVTN